jgi:hypothetical protein
MKRILILAALPLLIATARADELENFFAAGSEAQVCVRYYYVTHMRADTLAPAMVAGAVLKCEPPLIAAATRLEPDANKAGLHDWIMNMAVHKYEEMMRGLRQ